MNENMKDLEAYFLQLVEEKQLEFIWHPDRREKCEIAFTHEHRAMTIYVYREDCPMSAFREYAMFHLLMWYAGSLADDGKVWVSYAARAASYLRELPTKTLNDTLGFFYSCVAGMYEESGDSRRSSWYQKRAVVCQLNEPDEFNMENFVGVIQDMSADELLLFCLYVLRYIVEQGCFGEDDFYKDWSREHYEVAEYVLDEAMQQFADDESSTVTLRSFFLFLKAVYFKRTRRFVLAENVLNQYLALPESEGDEKYLPADVIYALLGECSLHRMDETQAAACFLKVQNEVPLVREYVQALLQERNASADELNQALAQVVADTCCRDNATSQFLKENVDKFFAPPEICDDEEGEEEEHEYTFDDWYADAEGGDSLAQLVVGHLYYMGEYVTRNYRLAREWFYLSALQGNAVAQMKLAYMYAHGYGTEVNEPEAAKWRQKAETNQGEEIQEYGNLILTDE